MAREINLKDGVDWTSVLLYAILVLFGWLNIYAAVYSPDFPTPIFELSHSAGRQLMFICLATVLILLVLFLDYKFFDSFAYIIYAVMIVVLVLTIFIAPDIKGSHSWIKLGTFSLQPAEFSKLATALALSKYFGELPGNNMNRKLKDFFIPICMILLPMAIIIMQNETGSALVFAAFIIVFYREGLPGLIPAVGIILALLVVAALVFPKLYVVIGLVCLAGIIYFLIPRYNRSRTNLILIGAGVVISSIVVLGVDFAISNLLQPHQQKRIKALINPNSDPLGAGWNVTQSKVAISAGGPFGKGYLQGTQTKFDFVPEQSTDFIFCTIGEEWGFVGSTFVVLLFLFLLYHLIDMAERQRNTFSRVYGYCVVAVLFFHLMVNVGMTIGLMPVIGIPLPYFSYGGSSLWAFTIFLFIFLKLDAHRSYSR